MSLLAPQLVYLLCLATSLVCAVLLARAHGRSRHRLLLWCAISFALLALNNLLLVADLVLLPARDLWIWRQVAAAAALGVLLGGFIWERD
ncbi:hypothetical protein ASD38_04820 [Caulobacter sp. Root487D2Y]|uniref:DUF5985 family protein n=1 Tax=Caulobacter sp. Root487D2Y TaxID=1736547 RepID=UPI0006F83C0E|nr:DUF5985 family protein [Caulobacter sp. Root487D2Y]KQY35870.1 hypothetical protein ASD38_04820 [Caulobacter sp. Root487D2Y]